MCVCCALLETTYQCTVNLAVKIFSDSLACAKLKPEHMKIHDCAILTVMQYRVVCQKII